MTEFLVEREIRDRFVITIPSIVRDILNLNIRDRVRFERNSEGDICIFKVKSHRVNDHKRVVDEEAAEEFVEGRPPGVV